MVKCIVDTVTTVVLNVQHWPAPLVNCAVNDALLHAVPSVQQTLLQFVDVVNTRLADTLLDYASDLVVHRVEVRAVWWPEVRPDEVGCFMTQQLESLASRGTVLLEHEKCPRHVTDCG